MSTIRMNKIQHQQVWNVILPLFLSLSIYLFFRPHDIAINQLVSLWIPPSFFSNQINASNWIVYNLPGALWVYSFLSIFITKNGKGLLFCLIPLVGAISIEVFQYFHITDGTYDFIDIIFYLIAWGVFMCSWLMKGNKVRWFRSSEKISFNEFTILLFFFGILILSDVF